MCRKALDARTIGDFMHLGLQPEATAHEETSIVILGSVCTRDFYGLLLTGARAAYY